MGSTVLTGKHASAFRTKTGKIIYALFEEAYSKNCIPHTPRWCCITIGEINAVLSDLFRAAYSCEGGSLQSKGGQILPENYITHWLQKLQNPTLLPDINIHLKVSDSIYAIVPKDKFDLVQKKLTDIGKPELIDQIQEGVYTTLFEDYELILELFGAQEKEHLSPWRIIAPQFNQEIDTSLAPTFTKKPYQTEQYQVFKIDNENRVVKKGNLPLQLSGWQYSAVGNFVGIEAYLYAMMDINSVKPVIKEFRDACTNAPPLPPDTVITVTRDPSLEKYQLNWIDQFAVEIGIIKEGETAPDKFNVKFIKVPKNNMLGHLPAKQVTFDLPKEYKSQITGLNPVQQDLLLVA